MRKGLTHHVCACWRVWPLGAGTADGVTTSGLVDEFLGGPAPALPADAAALDTLYRYRVPVTTDDGACAASKDLAPEPFDLGAELLGASNWAAVAASHPVTTTLQRLGGLVKALAERVQVDWLGVYRLQTAADGCVLMRLGAQAAGAFAAHGWGRGEGGRRLRALRRRYLVKLAYVGRPSRAIFPLNELFHDISNNSWVAMEGRPKLIQDVGSYDGPYYACDGDVQSELCVPILDSAGTVLGIIDAESFNKAHFNVQRAADVLQACADLGRWRLGFS